MAKSVKAGKTGIKTKKEKFVLKFPSKYGSHASMVEDASSAEAVAFLAGRELTEEETLCKDEFFYVTFKSRLDNGMADPARMYK